MTTIARPDGSLTRRISNFLYKRTKVGLALLLAPPTFWLALVYIASLAALLVTAFWTVDSFTGNLKQQWNIENFVDVLTQSTYQAVTLRTLGIALTVTFIDVAIALPVAFYMSKVALGGWQKFLVISMTLPLWSSYLVKAYSWRSVLSSGGILDWILNPFGISSPGFGLEGTVITLSYLWFPFVVLPIYTALQRVPNSLIEASADLGGGTLKTIRSVVVPMIVPGIIAGSIFSFSLTLGDYIAVKIVGGATQTLGTLIYTNVGTANNLPMAAAIAFIPLAIILAYLASVKRTGALENL
ncbi:MAG: ABC transporter permease [Actinomycetota bacterium]